ncbi:MAG: haloacid dehalogenase type II [Acidimicrobiia bacterium]|nr:haloacid dehalogenase type II [Acidimicrobiia bacterium]NND14430.1 haloacid dehalogenase type II [Acidimicrobiia bacterium]
MRRLQDFSALTFDCYGTLIDWESGIWNALQPLLTSSTKLIDRQDVLEEFAREEGRLQQTNPTLAYPRILELVHERLASTFDVPATSAMHEGFGRSVRLWPAFPDSASALKRLQQSFRLVILSNVDRKSFSASNDKLDIEFDAVYTAEDIGSYKPSPANFEYLLDHVKSDLSMERNDLLHTAQSMFHDHVPAMNFGLATAWIDRQNLAGGGRWGATAVVPDRPQPDFRFTSLEEMADAVETGLPPNMA